MKEKKAQIVIYCKIYTDNYKTLDGIYSGDEIVKHLLEDAQCSINEDGNIIPGDKNIWYLCTNEKHGYIYLDTNKFPYEWSWGFGDSSVKIIKDFIDRLFLEKIISTKQHDVLMKEIRIARSLGDMYEIDNYLKTIIEGKEWTPKITNTKKKSKELLQVITQNFEEQGYKFKHENKI